MDDDDTRDFNWAKGLIKQGRFQEARPILNQLFKRYPENGEIEELRAKCLQAGQSDANRLTDDRFPYNPKNSTEIQGQVATSNNTYIVPIIGSIAMLASVFLPWFSVSVSSGFINIAATSNGLGNFEGSAILVSALHQRGSSFTDGVFILGLGVLAILVSIVGFVNNNPNAWKAGILFGLVGGGIAIYDAVRLSSTLDDLNNSLNSDSSSGVASNVQLGFGPWLGAIGGLVVIIGCLAVNNKRV
ncbi:MAG: tetratricopeptide repeat protein [Chloroflexi bacterium]|nr:tetratricopeptide repeat protein [Chloroflexota bacterium]OJV98308.1 MAG: hypothetical protein BGO39_16135 [Chloroflexi bacterium 54-19]